MPQNYFFTFFRKNPFVRLLIPLVLGIVLGYYYAVDRFVLEGVYIVCLLFALGIFYRENYRRKRGHYTYWFASFIYLGLFALGADLSRRQIELKSTEEELIERAYVKAVILESPTSTKWGSKTVTQLTEQITKGEKKRLKSKVNLHFEDSVQHLRAGDVLIFPTEKLKKINTGYTIPYQFNYNRYLVDKGIYYSAVLGVESWVKQSHSFSLYAFAQELRTTLLNKFQENGLKGQELGIVSALVLGDKQFLDKQTKSDYADAGAMHVLAVSGLHIGIVYLFLTSFFNLLTGRKRRKLPETVIILLGIWFFAFISGLSISVIRSAIMFTVLAIGGLFKRNISVYNTIAFSAFVLLLYKPSYLFDIGFQLSYAAVLGIVVFYPTVNNWLTFKSKIVTALWELTAVSLVAQIVTLPLVLFSFHQIPLYGILSNLFVVYLASILLILTLISIAFVWWLPVFKTLLSVIGFFADGLNYLTSFVAHLPKAVLGGLYINLEEVFLLYIGIIAILLFVKTHKTGWLPLSQIAFILLLVFIHFENYKIKTHTYLTIEKSDKALNINILKEGVNLFYTTEQNPKRLHYLFRKYKNYWEAHQSPPAEVITLHNDRNYLLHLDRKKYAIVNTLEGQKKFEQADCLLLNDVEEGGLKYLFPNSEFIVMNQKRFLSLELE